MGTAYRTIIGTNEMSLEIIFCITSQSIVPEFTASHFALIVLNAIKLNCCQYTSCRRLNFPDSFHVWCHSCFLFLVQIWTSIVCTSSGKKIQLGLQQRSCHVRFSKASLMHVCFHAYNFKKKPSENFWYCCKSDSTGMLDCLPTVLCLSLHSRKEEVI